MKYEEKKKERVARPNRLNVADEILHVLGMVNDNPFVQTINHNKDQVPNIILYTNEQILDLKHFAKYAKNQQIGIDRTLNLGTYYVTTLAYKNSDPSIPGLVTIVLNTYFIDMMMSWL